MLEIHTVGAGGGSIARFDRGGAQFKLRDLEACREFAIFAIQPLVIDVPAQVTYEEVLDALSAVDLGLLGRSDWFFFGLALF